jgi:hypothetical protein
LADCRSGIRGELPACYQAGNFRGFQQLEILHLSVLIGWLFPGSQQQAVNL